MTTQSLDYDEQKFAELLLYIAGKMGDVGSFGATVLNKVLFYSDFFHFAAHGKPITGAEYMRLDYGPAPRRLLPVQASLVELGRAAVVERQVGPRIQKRLEALSEADLKHFSASEIKTVDDVIEQARAFSATQLSEATHRLAGWCLAADRETIPYETVFLLRGAQNVTLDDRERAAALSAAA